MKKEITTILSALLLVFTFSATVQNLPKEDSNNLLINADRLDKIHWLYFGWAEDHPKAISLERLSKGKLAAEQYTMPKVTL